jgi:hypothetical protein
MCMVVTLFPWQMASDKTTPTASGIGAGFPLRVEGEANGEGSETHLPAPLELPLDLAQVLANQTRLIEVLTRSLENQRVQLAAHQLSGMALARWDTFSEVVRDATWAEFGTAFREHHVPQGIVQLKEDEFRELT